MSGKIDDPLDASLEAWPKEPDGLGGKFAALVLKFGESVLPLAAIQKIFEDQFSHANRIGRLEYLFDAIAIKFKLIEPEIANSAEKLRAVNARLETQPFQRAVATAFEEALRATDREKIEQLSAVLVGSLVPSQWADPNADLAALVRDLAQLGSEDIRALDVLRTAFREIISNPSNLNDPNQFAERMQDYRSAIQVNRIDPENFYASCARLNGFGLAIEVVRNPHKMHPNEYLFRPTRRGVALVDCLERFPKGVQHNTKNA
jgi:hypothetical protein